MVSMPLDRVALPDGPLASSSDAATCSVHAGVVRITARAGARPAGSHVDVECSHPGLAMEWEATLSFE